MPEGAWIQVKPLLHFGFGFGFESLGSSTEISRFWMRIRFCD